MPPEFGGKGIRKCLSTTSVGTHSLAHGLGARGRRGRGGRRALGGALARQLRRVQHDGGPRRQVLAHHVRQRQLAGRVSVPWGNSRML